MGLFVLADGGVRGVSGAAGVEVLHRLAVRDDGRPPLDD